MVFRLGHLLAFGIALFCAKGAYADAPDLAHRPMTQVQQVLTFIEIIKKYPHIMLSQYETAQKLHAVGLPGAEPSYNRGAEFGEILNNSTHDILKILGNFFPCWDWKIIGLCMKPSWPVPRFCPYVSYRLPKQKVDNHPQEMQSHYLPKIVNKLLLNADEATYYPLVKTVAEYNVNRASDSLKLQEMFGGPSVSDVPRFDFQDRGLDQVKTIDQEKRWRGARELKRGWTKNEYTVLPELFSKVLDHIPWSNCHKKLNVMMWSSDYPLMILPARWSLISFIVAPLEMINRFIRPQTCTGINSWLQGGKSPVDLLLTGNATQDAIALAWPGSGCQRGNQGPWVPVLNGAHTAFASGAAAVGIRKGMVTARKFMPSRFYRFDVNRDLIQYTRNDRMPSKCDSLEQYAVDFGEGNYQQDKEDPWYVAEVWKYFRCCTAGSGYHPIIGPHTQIKE
ncbi:MAG: hypothetical protein K1X79_04505 [Oligoflexia bacterium]|nr:hypothetical protein [Oligoflexia bacterium]